MRDNDETSKAYLGLTRSVALNNGTALIEGGGGDMVTSLLSPTALRKQLLELGYEPLPNDRKVCHHEKWSTILITVDAIESWPSHKWQDTGIRTGNVVFIDNDVEDELLQDLIESIIKEVTGSLSSYVRVGNPARKGYVYRQVDPDSKVHRKIQTGKWIKEETEQGTPITSGESMVEILRYGQQFGAYGQHSDKYHYDWPQKNLLDCKLEELPPITDDQAWKIKKDVESLFQDAGLVPKSENSGSRRRSGNGAEGGAADAFAEMEAKCDNLDEIRTAMKFIDPTDYEIWRTVGMALKVTQHPDAFDLWDSWSQGGNYPAENERSCEDVWSSYSDKATSSSLKPGTIFAMAKDGGWDGRIVNDNVKKQFHDRIKEIKKASVKIEWESVVDLLTLAIDSGADDGKCRELMKGLREDELVDVDFNMVKKKISTLRKASRQKGVVGKVLSPRATPSDYRGMCNALSEDIMGILPDIVLTMQGNIAAEQLATSWNILAVLQFAGVELRHNEMTHADETQHNITDCPLDEYALVNDLCLYARIKKTTKVEETVEQIAWKNRYYPPAIWLRSLEWDGISRFEDLFKSIDFESHVNLDYARTVMRKWFIQCVAGALSEKLVQLPHVLTFTADEGGEGKSEWFRALVPEFDYFQGEQGFSGGSNQVDDTMRLTGSWITELAEMEGTWRRRDVAHVKAFLSAVVDKYRTPYGKAVLSRKRRTSFCGSSNESENLLADRSGGNRRFWVLNVRRCNFKHGIDMEQVWSEVVTWFDAGEHWWLNECEQAVHRAEVDKALMLNEYDDYLEEHYGEYYDLDADPDSWVYGAIRASDLVEMQGGAAYTKVTQSARNQARKALRRFSEFKMFDRIPGTKKRKAYKIRVKKTELNESGDFTYGDSYIDILPIEDDSDDTII